MEYLNGKDLHKIFTEGNNKLILDDIRFILYQVFSALCYLHQKNMVHRDIEPANIICAKNNWKYDLKIIDFGLSVNLEKRGKTKLRVHLQNLSSEGLKEIIHVKNDIWACELCEDILKEEIE